MPSPQTLERFIARVEENGAYLATRLGDLSSELGLGEVRGKGLLLALELNQAVGTQVGEAALQRRLLLNSPRPATLRFMPALNVTREEIDQMMDILRSAIRDVGEPA